MTVPAAPIRSNPRINSVNQREERDGEREKRDGFIAARCTPTMMKDSMIFYLEVGGGDLLLRRGGVGGRRVRRRPGLLRLHDGRVAAVPRPARGRLLLALVERVVVVQGGTAGGVSGGGRGRSGPGGARAAGSGGRGGVHHRRVLGNKSKLHVTNSNFRFVRCRESLSGGASP